MTVPTGGLPQLVREGLSVYPVPPALKGPRRLEVVKADEGTRGTCVQFAGISDLGASASLVGKTLLAAESDLPENLSLMDAESLVGISVVDERFGNLGTVREVLRGPAGDVWSVRGAFGEVLIPAVDEFVLGQDDDGAIHVRVPDGLVSGGGR